MTNVQFSKITGRLRIPRYQEPDFLELDIPDDRQIVSITWTCPARYSNSDRKTNDWNYTIWTVWRG